MHYNFFGLLWFRMLSKSYLHIIYHLLNHKSTWFESQRFYFSRRKRVAFGILKDKTVTKSSEDKSQPEGKTGSLETAKSCEEWPHAMNTKISVRLAQFISLKKRKQAPVTISLSRLCGYEMTQIWQILIWMVYCMTACWAVTTSEARRGTNTHLLPFIRMTPSYKIPTKMFVQILRKRSFIHMIMR